MNLPFFIAKRYLISKKSHNAINIISGISIAGICIGTMALVIVLSAFNGMTDLVQSLYNTFDSDIEITIKNGKYFDPNSPEIQAIKKIKGVIYFTEVAEGNVLLKLKDKQCIATAKGVSNEFERMNNFDTVINEGNFNLQKNNIVLGKGLSTVLQSNTNDFFSPITVYAPKRGVINSLNPEDGLNELKVFTAGIFSINDEFDYKYLFMNIAKARELLDIKQEVTSIELKISNQKEIVQNEITAMLGNNYEVKNREQQNSLLYKTMKSEKLWVFIILVFILIIATFNVIGSLTILIIEKKKDINILNNLGADKILIQKIFLIEGMLITFMGALLGLVLGIFICWMQIKFSFIKLSEGWIVDAYPVKIVVSDILMIVGTVSVIGLLSAWYPVKIFSKKM